LGDGHGEISLNDFELPDLEALPSQTVFPAHPVADRATAEVPLAASKFDCDACALKMRCCPNMAVRQVPRDIHEDARDMARRLMGTKRFLKSRDERKRVEMRFAHLKINTALNACDSEGPPVRVTNFISPPSYRTSRPWPFDPSVHPSRSRSGPLRDTSETNSRLPRPSSPVLDSPCNPGQSQLKNRLFRQHRPGADFGA
jgi:hypothetical protein